MVLDLMLGLRSMRFKMLLLKGLRINLHRIHLLTSMTTQRMSWNQLLLNMAKLR